MSNYIGISEDRLHHILGVSRKAYSIAKDMGYGEPFARKMFMLGWNHDVGYEFSEEQTEHADISATMIVYLMNNDGVNNKNYYAIKRHGYYAEDETVEWKILNMADMLIDSKGNEVTVSQRLDDIKERYGEHSNQYLTACDICYRIGLTAINIAANIT